MVVQLLMEEAKFFSRSPDHFHYGREVYPLEESNLSKKVIAIGFIYIYIYIYNIYTDDIVAAHFLSRKTQSTYKEAPVITVRL